MRLSIAVGITAIVALAAGSAAGYFFAKSQLQSEFDEQMKLEIAQTKEFYARYYKTKEFETPETAVETLVPAAADALRSYQGINPAPSVTEEHRKKAQETLRNIFSDKAEEPSESVLPEREKLNRTEEAPYVLEKDEYFENESGYTQSSLTYFDGDGILTDARDDVIDEVDKTIGEYNLKKFGHGSGDPRVVYIRNDVLELEFEVLKHDATYKKHVAGLDD